MSERRIKNALDDANDKISFLEKIYQTGAFSFSSNLTDAAFNERQELCQLTSACYAILRERTLFNSLATPPHENL